VIYVKKTGTDDKGRISLQKNGSPKIARTVEKGETCKGRAIRENPEHLQKLFDESLAAPGGGHQTEKLSKEPMSPEAAVINPHRETNLGVRCPKKRENTPRAKTLCRWSNGKREERAENGGK